MRRLLCLWLPGWPLQRLLVAQPELRGRPLVLWNAPGRGQPRKRAAGRGAQVVWASRTALACGVAPGMPLAEAEALLGRGGAGRPDAPRPAGQAWVPKRHEPRADREALQRLAQACQCYSPQVRLETAPQPEGLFLEIAGCAHLFGGEEALASRAVVELAAAGWIVRAAVADTPAAAWAVARFAGGAGWSGGFCRWNPVPGSSATEIPLALAAESAAAAQAGWCVVPVGRAAAALAPLPLAALGLEPAVERQLAELGVGRIEQLWALPRGALAARLGAGVLLRSDEALGGKAEVLPVERSAAPLAVAWSFEEPAARRELLAAALKRLLDEVGRLLDERLQAVRQLECRLQCETAGRPAEVCCQVGLFRPTASPRYLGQLLDLQLERAALPGPVARIVLEVTAAVGRQVRQQRLFADPAAGAEPQQWAGLIERLTSRLGREAVTIPRLVSDAQPEQAVRCEPWIASARGGRRGSIPAAIEGVGWWQRPLRLASRPVAVPVWGVAPDGPPQKLCWEGQPLQIVAARGPERIETGWWRGRPVGRDYYQVDTDRGGRLWLFRRLRDGRWFLHGWFD